jgi:hypothetical protein
MTQQVLDGPAALVAAISELWTFLAATRKPLSVQQSSAELHSTQLGMAFPLGGITRLTVWVAFTMLFSSVFDFHFPSHMNAPRNPKRLISS